MDCVVKDVFDSLLDISFNTAAAMKKREMAKRPAADNAAAGTNKKDGARKPAGIKKPGGVKKMKKG